MNKNLAYSILGQIAKHDKSLDSLRSKLWDSYLTWHPNSTRVTIDGDLSHIELEALAWWMKKYGK